MSSVDPDWCRLFSGRGEIYACAEIFGPKSCANMRDKSAVYIHPSSVVAADSQIGPGSRIWHFCHIMAGARVGKKCNLGQNTFVGRNVIIGDGCKIQNNVSVYEGVELGAGVFVGPSVVFTNIKRPRAHIRRDRSDYQKTWIGRGVSIGANTTVIAGIRVGDWALIGAGSLVRQDIAPHALVAGNPLRQLGWVCHCGENLPRNPVEHGNREPLVCPACQMEYPAAEQSGPPGDHP